MSISREEMHTGVEPDKPEYSPDTIHCWRAEVKKSGETVLASEDCGAASNTVLVEVIKNVYPRNIPFYSWVEWLFPATMEQLIEGSEKHRRYLAEKVFDTNPEFLREHGKSGMLEDFIELDCIGRSFADAPVTFKLNRHVSLEIDYWQK